ncbi:hypothetical protein [Streptomyces sp. AK02-01A]|uniref:hypothetical protein n=1 Tax=Streptomyces sp. AK02-01A TaxID=3028648 RepID=UPI0029BF3EF7|nr:hypothetical protein [Streptomyces sp. AK02-01A]MDX3852294.1 hypothetical protein [Streptomyces sp. AK02-01A]
MADERDAWPDKDTAERLLSGEPVGAVDEHVRRRAERLAGALREIGAVTYANDAELPGEKAALAAFRRRRTAGGERPGPVRPEGPRAEDLLATVRLAPAPGAVRPRRSGHSLRTGLVAAVAGCALGAVAVVGLLPALFDGERGSVPGGPVSAAASPGPLVSESTDGGRGPSGHPSGFPDTPGKDGMGHASPGPSYRTGSGAAGGPAGPDGDATDEAGDADDDAGTGGEHGGWSALANSRAGQRYREAVRACRDYRSGKIDAKAKVALESAVHGAPEVERLCDRLLGEDGGGTGGEGVKSGGGGADDGASDGGGLPGSPAGPPVSWPSTPPEPGEPSPSAPSPELSPVSGPLPGDQVPGDQDPEPSPGVSPPGLT